MCKTPKSEENNVIYIGRVHKVPVNDGVGIAECYNIIPVNEFAATWKQ
jgi:hypothetical protein